MSDLTDRAVPESNPDDDGRSLDERLLPDQPRFMVFVFRLPRALPVEHGRTWTLDVEGDLGDDWDIDAVLQPEEGWQGRDANMRHPSVSIKVWQPIRPNIPVIDFGTMPIVARDIFGDFPWPDFSGCSISGKAFDLPYRPGAVQMV